MKKFSIILLSTITLCTILSFNIFGETSYPTIFINNINSFLNSITEDFSVSSCDVNIYLYTNNDYVSIGEFTQISKGSYGNGLINIEFKNSNNTKIFRLSNYNNNPYFDYKNNGTYIYDRNLNKGEQIKIECLLGYNDSDFIKYLIGKSQNDITFTLPTPILTLEGTLLKFSNYGDELNTSKVIEIYDINDKQIGTTTYNQYNINYPNGYYIKIHDRNKNIYSDKSNVVYYALNEETENRYPKPQFNILSINNYVNFTNIPNQNIKIAVYKNNQLYDSGSVGLISGAGYNPKSNGNYRFMYYDDNGNFSDISDVLVVDWIDESKITIDNHKAPIINGINNYEIQYDSGIEPTDNNIISWLKYYIDNFNSFISTIFNGILDLFKNAVKSINSLFPYVQQFVNSFGDLFAFVPPQIRDIFVSCIAISILFAIIKFIKN